MASGEANDQVPRSPGNRNSRPRTVHRIWCTSGRRDLSVSGAWTRLCRRSGF